MPRRWASPRRWPARRWLPRVRAVWRPSNARWWSGARRRARVEAASRAAQPASCAKPVSWAKDRERGEPAGPNRRRGAGQECGARQRSVRHLPQQRYGGAAGRVARAGAAHVGAAGPRPGLRTRLRLPRGCRGRPLRVDDAMRDPRVPEAARPHYAGYGLIAFAAVPLPPASGVLVVCRERPIGEREVNELLPYAAQLVAAVTARGEVRRLSAADEEHAVAEEWLWWLVNAVQDPALLTDEANNILLANQHAERLLKPGPDDSAGKRYAIEINNVLLSASLSSFALEHEGGASRELTLVDPIEGTELLFELIRKPATNLRTGERAQACVLKDVTDLRRALDELKQTLSGLEAAGEQARQERDRLDLILSNVADPIVVADPDGQIMRMNQPAARLLQAGAAGAPADVSTAYLANDARFSSFLSQLRLESSAGKQGEIQLVDPETGELLTMSLTATEVQERLGQVTAIVCVLHDLTRVRELERRTLEQQLFESEKLAAVGRLAAATAHEINNPLEAIKNALYLLISRTAADDPNHQFLEIASRETERVSTIMRQMLGFYRPVVEKSITDVNQVLGEALALLDRQLRQARIGVRTRLDPALPAILASADQLKIG